MKTSFFLNNEFEEDDIEIIKKFQVADSSLFDKIVEWFLSKKEFPRINKEVLKQFAIEFDKSAEEVNNAFSSIFWFNSLFSKNEQIILDDFLLDIERIYPQSIVDKSLFSERLQKIINISDIYRMYYKIEKAKNAGSPKLKYGSTSVILKPVIDEKFDFDCLDIKEYKPVILKYEPCVLLEFTDTNDKSLSFQMDSEAYERFLNNLIALQIELNKTNDDFTHTK